MTEQEKSYASYALGVNIGQNLIENGISSIDFNRFLEGVKAELLNRDLDGDAATLNAAMQQFLRAAQSEKSEAVVAAGKAYMEDNAKRDEVTTLDSGMQYEVINTGDGASPALSDQVTTHYHGMLTSGEVFDSSVQRGEPATFPVSGVIAGWTEALQLMKVGDKWRLSIPPELAYGERAAGSIPPHSTLIFDVELLSIN